MNVTGRQTFPIFFKLVSELHANKSSPLEGVLKFGYLLFREKELYENCAIILDNYCHINNKHNYWPQDEDAVYSVAIGILCQCLMNLQPFEKEHLLELTSEDKVCFWQLVEHLIYNEIMGGYPKINLLFELFPCENNFAEIRRRLPDLDRFMTENLIHLLRSINSKELTASPELLAFLKLLNSSYKFSGDILHLISSATEHCLWE